MSRINWHVTRSAVARRVKLSYNLFMAEGIAELIEKGRGVSLPIDGATIEAVNEYAASRIFRDSQGCVRGVIFPFKEEGGQIHTGQGDVFVVDKEGKFVRMERESGQEEHEAAEIETEEHITLQGMKTEVTKKDVREAFGGEIIPGMPVVVRNKTGKVEPGVYIMTRRNGKIALYDPFREITPEEVEKHTGGRNDEEVKVVRDLSDGDLLMKREICQVAEIPLEEAAKYDIRYVTALKQSG